MSMVNWYTLLTSKKDTPQKTASAAQDDTKQWEIDKRGNFSLIGFECTKYAGVKIKDGEDQDLETYTVLKQGRDWRSLISQSVWQSKLEEFNKTLGKA